MLKEKTQCSFGKGFLFKERFVIIPPPKAKETIQEGDRIVMYGPLEVSRDLFKKE